MRILTTEEMQKINGGITYKCPTCGYKTKSLFKSSLHAGIFTWHFFTNGGRWIVIND